MRSIGKLFAAFTTLTDSVLSLAGVLDAAAARLRQQLALETEPAAVLEHQTAGEAEAETPATKGRRKAS